MRHRPRTAPRRALLGNPIILYFPMFRAALHYNDPESKALCVAGVLLGAKEIGYVKG
jgi:hypothetical protein